MADEFKVPQEVTRRYREMGAEEPPRALDDAILSAARRSARPWTRRWAVPLSLAAVLVLSVTVTLRIQHEQPGIESPVPVAREAAREAQKDVPPAAKARDPLPPRVEKPSRPAPRSEPQPFPPAQDAAVAAAPAPAPSPAPAPAAASAPAELAAPVQALSKRPEAPSARSMAPEPETPERELERIAQLRRDAKHEEADKALAEFRRRYPDYRIPAPMLERVEKR